MSHHVRSEYAAHAIRVWRRSHLIRHVIEMYLAMQIGMVLGPLVFAIAIGAPVTDAREQHPVAFLIVMALSMTLPMVAWMLHRGHSWRSAGEMAVVMLAPAVPLVGLQLAGIIGASGCAYMSVSTIAMVALIIHRRTEYRATAAAHASAGRSHEAPLRPVRSDAQNPAARPPTQRRRRAGRARARACSVQRPQRKERLMGDPTDLHGLAVLAIAAALVATGLIIGFALAGPGSCW